MSADPRAANFIDSNVLIYQLDTQDPRRHAIAERIISETIATEKACISLQCFRRA